MSARNCCGTGSCGPIEETYCRDNASARWIVRLHLTHGWKQRLAGSMSPGTPAVINFIIWIAVLLIVLLMAVSTAG